MCVYQGLQRLIPEKLLAPTQDRHVQYHTASVMEVVKDEGCERGKNKVGHSDVPTSKNTNSHTEFPIKKRPIVSYLKSKFSIIILPFPS